MTFERRHTMSIFLLLFLALASSSCNAPSADKLDDVAEWRHYAADRGSTKYSPAAQIDASNVADLEIAWRWTTPDSKLETGEFPEPRDIIKAIEAKKSG